ncbi:GNAT family N-acetyltransferase [Roseomonas terrae]|jgi:ribosomal-protein-alanine N-acetyltransferase|uniref:GNAT family N-acetyltransferase n=1 Tax=Neoroseomonas terrae TaxID=424799 RepID=A0ABS5EBM3_9PROT|nr:GNAT family N-acetyltransferase [Neoroseomonas terrae]MBR0648406.1 GNAT family N-acetyltransferase [Neoroseomonas terrae]
MDRWRAQAIALLLELPGHFALLATAGDDPLGFGMGRVAADQAEVLTLAVRPSAQRGGVGRLLMQAITEEAAGRGATELFLEVAESNVAARCLYVSLGAIPAGRRRAYYPDGGDALVLRLPLIRPGAEGAG